MLVDEWMHDYSVSSATNNIGGVLPGMLPPPRGRVLPEARTKALDSSSWPLRATGSGQGEPNSSLNPGDSST